MAVGRRHVLGALDIDVGSQLHAARNPSLHPLRQVNCGHANDTDRLPLGLRSPEEDAAVVDRRPNTEGVVMQVKIERLITNPRGEWQIQRIAQSCRPLFCQIDKAWLRLKKCAGDVRIATAVAMVELSLQNEVGADFHMK